MRLGDRYAEMDKDKKNSISHRGKALEKFRKFLETYEPVINEESS